MRPFGTFGSSGFNPIKHVVIIVQENRSFDNLFAGYPGADAPMTGTMSNGKQVALGPISMRTTDIDHSYGSSVQDYDGGKMDGFDQNSTNHGPAGKLAYSYVLRGITAPYWSMAQQYALADRMFQTEHGPSWTSHINIIAGTTSLSPTRSLVDFPSNYPFDCDAVQGTQSTYLTHDFHYAGNGPYPCFTQFHTMADTLDAAGISWRYYAESVTGPNGIGGYWSPFAAVKSVRYGPDWAKVVSPPPKVLTDVAAGRLADVTWVTPEWEYSDHAGGSSSEGPSWVSAIVNEIGTSQYWDSTAIFVVWDDWGGWYDDAVPPQLDYKGLGLRVPCLIISPYARAGYVSHTQYEFASILVFIEQTFNLPQLGSAADGYTDARATSIIDSFNFSQPPIPFQPIKAPYNGPFFEHLVTSHTVPDDE